MSIADRLDDIIEDHLEGPLFRDPNIPRVNAALTEFRDAVLELLTAEEEEEGYEYNVRNALGHFRFRCGSLDQVRRDIEKEREGLSFTPVRLVFRRKRFTLPEWEPVEDWK